MRTSALFFALLASAWAGEPGPGPAAPPPGLLLSVSADSGVYEAGAPIRLRLSLRNAGERSLRLFHPASIDRLWPGWRLEGWVLRPDGKECAIEPEIRYALLGVPGARHFRSLAPGGSLELPVSFRPGEPREGAWVALLPVQAADARLTPEALRKKYGLRGEFSFVGSGKQEFLSLTDPGDLFSKSGSYALRFAYTNKARGFMELEGRRNRFVAVPDAWNGSLEAAVNVVIK